MLFEFEQWLQMTVMGINPQSVVIVVGAAAGVIYVTALIQSVVQSRQAKQALRVFVTEGVPVESSQELP